FAYADRSRARLLIASSAIATDAHPRSLTEIQKQLPPSAELLYYATLTDRLLIWRVTRAESEFIEHSINRQDLTRLVSQHLAWVTDRGRGVSPANDALFAAAIRPALAHIAHDATLVIIPDGDLQRLPFATIRNPDVGRYLVEDHALIEAASASLFVA